MSTVARRVESVLSTALTLVIVCGVVAVAGVAALVHWRDWSVAVVATNSMAPSMPSGSLVLDRPVSGRDAKVGQIITFRPPTGVHSVAGGKQVRVSLGNGQHTVSHRVVAVHRDADTVWLETKGDNNKDADPWRLPAANVEARVVVHVPLLGRALTDGTARRGALFAAFGIGVLVMVGQARVMAGELRGHGRHREPASPHDTTAT